MNSIKQRDLEQGQKEEERVKPILERHFNLKLSKTGKNCVVDFEDDNNVFELKSRNNAYSKYPDTMIGTNKIEYAQKSNKNVYFVFSYTDGLYYWKYDPEYPLTQKQSGRQDRGFKEFKQYSYIPIDILTKINV